MPQLRTEIKIHRSLNHPHIVRFYQYYEDADNVYILLELCDNNTMNELIRRRRRFSEEDARRYMVQMLEAVHYCHRNAIIHRDLKLGNLFLDARWGIKMGDFGLAAKVSGDGRRKTICGTPNYIAPEILEGRTGHSYQVNATGMARTQHPTCRHAKASRAPRRDWCGACSAPRRLMLASCCKS
jgi:serine/threonine protein kinase